MEGGEERGDGVKVMFTNCQSVVNKICELRALVALENPDVVALTETWTNENIDNGYLQIVDYEIIVRKDRVDTDRGRGGGLLVYVRKSIDALNTDINTEFNQCASISIKCKSEDVNIHVIYRSPNSNKSNDDALNNWVKELRGTNVLIGDFNFPDIDWANGTSGSRGRDFFDTTTEMFLEQHMDGPTHASGNVLDLILTDQEGLIYDVNTNGRIGKSDHDLISFKIMIDENRNNVQRESLNYRRANFVEMRRTMQTIDWEDKLGGKNANEMWIAIRGCIQNQMEMHIPKKKMRSKTEPMWMDEEIKKHIREKKKAWKTWKEKKTERSKEEYKKTVTTLKRKIRNKKNSLERKIAESRKSNPKMFYSFINSAKKTRTKIGPLHDDQGAAVTDPRKQARILNNYYASVFTSDNDDLPEIRTKTESKIDNIVFNENDVERIIDSLNEQSAMGPDGIPPRVLKELKHEIKKPLTMLFKTSMETGLIPDDWRKAEVVPIFKKGKKSEPGNYRPVSLTSIPCKMMERITNEQTIEHLESNNLISNAQHGFRAGRSPQTNLVEFFDTATKWLDKGRSYDVLYLDFQKAFDKVCHRRLAIKLKAVGITGNLLAWLIDWLRDRKQRVKIDGKYSEWTDVVSSVIQGSVLGGTLFNVYIDDIVEIIVEAFARIFADDTKVAKLVESVEDGGRMQELIDELGRWAVKWRMSFNASKCKIVHVGNKNPRIKYKLNGVEIPESENEKDLGVIVSSTLKPSKQCAAAAKAANFALGQIQRAFHYRKKSNLVPLFKTFVRPKLEFAVAAWSPWTEADANVMEKVQRRLVRMLSDVRGNTYEEKLRNAGLTTLKDRRKRGDAIETFKTLKGINNVIKTDWFTIESEDARPTRANTEVTEEGVRRRENVLRTENARLEIRRNWYNVRAAIEWNNIPDEVRMKTTTNSFKTAYDKWARTEININETA